MLYDVYAPFLLFICLCDIFHLESGCSFLAVFVILIQEYLAPEIISHYVMHGSNIAEVVKQLIAVLRKKDENIFGIYLEALKRVRHWLTVLN